MTQYVIGIGTSNFDGPKMLQIALDRIIKHPSLELFSHSTSFQNIGKHCPNPRIFSNAALIISTKLSPDALWFELHKLEQNLGRIRTIKNGPRTIDIDVLWNTGNKIKSHYLKIPHPLFTQRPFALIPSSSINACNKNIPLKNCIRKAYARFEIKMPGQSLEKNQLNNL